MQATWSQPVAEVVVFSNDFASRRERLRRCRLGLDLRVLRGVERVAGVHLEDGGEAAGVRGLAVKRSARLGTVRQASVAPSGAPGVEQHPVPPRIPARE